MLVETSARLGRVMAVGMVALWLTAWPLGGTALAQYFGAVGIVDMDFILGESAAMKSASEQLDGFSSKYQEEISGEEEKLRARDATLQEQRTILSEEAWTEQAIALQADIEKLDQKVLAVRRALDSLFEETVVRIQQVIVDEISVLARERGMTLVLPLTSILYASEFFNVTEETLERLNTRVPGVELDITEEQLTNGEEGEN